MALAPFILMLFLLLPSAADAAGPLVVAAGDSLVLEGVTLRATRWKPAAVVRGTLILRDCLLEGRPGRQPLVVCEGEEARLMVEQCRLWQRPRRGWALSSRESDPSSDTGQGNRTLSAPLVALRGGVSRFQHSTLAGPPGHVLLQVEEDATASLYSCLLSGGDGPQPAIVAKDPSSVDLAWCLSDRVAWAGTYPPFARRKGNQTATDLRLVDPARGDLRPRWNSPALDTGDPAAPLDFDLSRADIGWGELMPPIVLSGSRTKLPRGWYLIPDNSDITVAYTEAMPPGTIFRLGSGAALTIVGRSRSGTFAIGDPDGVRSAFVGLTNPEFPEQAASLTLGGARGETLQVRGTLWMGLPERLVFKHSHVELTPGTFTTLNTLDVGMGLSAVRLELVDCTGEITGFDFRSRPLPLADLALVRSGVQLRDCRFGLPTARAGHALLVEGRAPGRRTVISDCSFAGGSTTCPSLQLLGADLRLERTQFDHCLSTAIRARSGRIDLSRGARNSFRSTLSIPPVLLQFIDLDSTRVELVDGENNFVFNNVQDQPRFAFIRHRGPEPIPDPGAPDLWHYTRNFWGSDCSMPVSTSGRIPAWADPGVPLTQCSDPAGAILHPGASTPRAAP